MKKNTKIFALVMSIAMLFSAFSLTAFAADFDEDQSSSDLVDGYMCKNEIYYTKSTRYMRTTATLTKNLATSGTAKVVSQCVIGYTDGNFDIDYQSSPEKPMYYGSVLSITAQVYGDSSKMVQYIANDSHYVVNGEAYSLGGTWYAGEDF